MKKKSNKELGVLMPECMVDAIANEELKDEQVGRLVRAVVLGDMKYVEKDILARTLANSFRSEYRNINSSRIESIKLRRKRNQESEKRRRNLAKISEKMLEKAVETDNQKHMGAHVRPCATKVGRNNRYINTPHISPQGGRGGVKSGSVSTDGTDAGQAPDAMATFAEIWARHPRKEGEARAKRALAAIAKKNPAALKAIGTAHERWCATDRWTKEGGRYAPRLAAWLAEEGWTDEPPEKKPARPEEPPTRCGMGL